MQRTGPTPHNPPPERIATRRACGAAEFKRPGLCLTIEPMINTDSRHVTSEDKHDGWTVRTKDGGFSAQFEHTVLMTEKGPEVLTYTKHGPQKGHKF